MIVNDVRHSGTPNQILISAQRAHISEETALLLRGLGGFDIEQRESSCADDNVRVFGSLSDIFDSRVIYFYFCIHYLRGFRVGS